MDNTLNIYGNDNRDNEIRFCFRDGNHQQDGWQSYAHPRDRKRGGVCGSHAVSTRVLSNNKL